MIIKIYSNKSNTIFDCYNNNFRSRSWDANAGSSPYLQVFAQKDPTSGSLLGNSYARSLIQFDLSQYHSVMNRFNLASSSISCSLKMYNMPHGDTVPTSYEIYLHPISQSWDSGTGIDTISYKDAGFSSWLSATSVNSWSATGSDYINSVYDIVHFDKGTENIDRDITNIFNWWIASGNFGLILKLNDIEETNDIDYYRKLFYSSNSDEKIYYPCIEVKVNDVKKDRRNSLILGRSGSIYLYNIIDGNLENLSLIGSSSMNVTVYNSTTSGSMSYSASFTSSYISTGIYITDIYIPSTYTGSILYDVWSSGSYQFLTGTINISSSVPSQNSNAPQILAYFENLQEEYERDDNVRFNFFLRNARWNLNQYYDNITDLPILVYDDVRYEVNDYTNQYVFITASEYTKCSYNNEGMYFDMPMSNFIEGYYEIVLKIRRNNMYETLKNDNWKFKVIE
jgi:hypothetical protein